MARKAKKVRKRAPTTRAHVAAGPTFLGLPAEVRNMIYRLLLVADRPLGSENGNEFDDCPELEWAEYGEYHLQPAILCTCRQVYQEAKPILFGENTIGIQIYGSEAPVESEFEYGSDPEYGYGYNHGYFDDQFDDDVEIEPKTLFMNFGLDEAWDYSSSRVIQIPSIKKFQRFEIVIATAILDLEEVEFEVKDLSSTLCKMPALEQLSLRLLEDSRLGSNQPTLGPFGMLRNLRSVAIRGVEKPFADRLKSLMLGNSPQENVKEMYRLLENYVIRPKGSISDLEKASTALKEWDFQAFKEIRSKILSDGQRSIEDAILRIGDADPKTDQHHQATTEEGHDHMVA